MKPYDRIKSIISIFETGNLPSEKAYSSCQILKDGAGISYGMHQATDKSGSLDAIVNLYASKQGQYSAAMGSISALLKDNLSVYSPNDARVIEAIQLLKQAGEDPIMQQCQEQVFDELYFQPAIRKAEQLSLKHNISLLVIYDTAIHSGLSRFDVLRKKFIENPPTKGGDEIAFISAYLKARRAWLLSVGGIVAKTTYRMDEIEKLLKDSKNYELQEEVIVRGIKV